MKFRARITVEIEISFNVEANDEDEAYQEAEKRLDDLQFTEYTHHTNCPMIGVIDQHGVPQNVILDGPENFRGEEILVENEETSIFA